MDLNVGRSIISAIAFIVAVVVSFILFNPIVSASDKVYLLFEKHCELNGNPFVRVYVADDGGDPDGPGAQVDLTPAIGSACQLGAIANPAPTAGDILVDEHGELVGTAVDSGLGLAAGQAITNSEVRDVLAINNNYETLARLILGIYPVLLVVSFLGVSASNLFSFATGRGADGIAMVVGKSIAGLLLVVVALAITPTFFEAANGAYLDVTSGRMNLFSTFGGIVELILNFVPILYLAGLIGVIIMQGALAFTGATGRRLGVAGM